MNKQEIKSALDEYALRATLDRPSLGQTITAAAELQRSAPQPRNHPRRTLRLTQLATISALVLVVSFVSYALAPIVGRGLAGDFNRQEAIATATAVADPELNPLLWLPLVKRAQSLNLSQTVASDTITLKRVYADSNLIAVHYTIQSLGAHVDAISGCANSQEVPGSAGRGFVATGGYGFSLICGQAIPTEVRLYANDKQVPAFTGNTLFMDKSSIVISLATPSSSGYPVQGDDGSYAFAGSDLLYRWQGGDKQGERGLIEAVSYFDASSLHESGPLNLRFSVDLQPGGDRTPMHMDELGYVRHSYSYRTATAGDSRPNEPFQYSFTAPQVAEQRTITAQQTLKVNGLSMTLDDVQLTPVQMRLHLRFSQPVAASASNWRPFADLVGPGFATENGYSNEYSLTGRQGNLLAERWERQADGSWLYIVTGNVYERLGDWALTVYHLQGGGAGDLPGPWIFKFNLPAAALSSK